MSNGLFLGVTDGREHPTDKPTGKRREVTLDEHQRATGMHVIGGPGSGKSKFLELCIRQDIDEGRGVCLIDPHGELYTEILTYCASIRHARNIIPLNLSTGQHIIGFNPFTAERGDPHTLVNRAIAALIKAWGLQNTNDMPTLESVVSCVLHAIIENGLTIAEAEHFLSYDQRTIRDYLASRIRNPAVLKEWAEISAGTRKEWREEWRSTRSKLLRFLRARPLLRFLALRESLDLRRIMDEGAVLLVNLQEAEGVFDETDARTFGSLLVSKFFAVARQRIRRDRTDPRPFYLYCDEFQEFVSPDVTRIVAQGRKMGLSLILAHQYLGQLDAEDQRLVKAVMGAVRTRVVFGVEDADDAETLVPAVFRGLIDYNEVKRIDYSVKFWPMYDRDQAITEGESESDSIGRQHGVTHTDTQSDTDTESRSIGTSEGHSEASGNTLGFGSGGFWPIEGAGGSYSDSYFDGTSEQSVDTSGKSMSQTQGEGHTKGTADGTSEAETEGHNKGRMRAVTNAPIYRPVPFLEGRETPWSLEEQKHRLAEVLLMQLQRMCWVKPRDALAQPVLVPMLKEFPLPRDFIDEYETEKATEAGAVTPAEADRQHIERTRQLERQAKEFFDRQQQGNVHSTPDHDVPPVTQPARGATVTLKPVTGKKSASARKIRQEEPT